MMTGNYKRSPYLKDVRKAIAKYNGISATEIGRKLHIARNLVISAINCCTDIAEDDEGKLLMVRW